MVADLSAKLEQLTARNAHLESQNTLLQTVAKMKSEETLNFRSEPCSDECGGNEDLEEVII